MSTEQERVSKFYKEFLSWKAESVGMWICAGILETIFVIIMMIPYQEMKSDMGFAAMPALFGFFGPMLYICPYISFREGQNSISIYEKLKYLPIDYGEIKKMRVTKLVLFVAKIFPIALVCNLLFTYLSIGAIQIEDVAYVVLMGLIFPIVSNLPYTWFSK